MKNMQVLRRDIKRDRFFIMTCFLFMALRGIGRYSNHDSIFHFDGVDVVLIVALVVAFFNISISRLKVDLLVEFERLENILEQKKENVREPIKVMSLPDTCHEPDSPPRIPPQTPV